MNNDINKIKPNYNNKIRIVSVYDLGVFKEKIFPCAELTIRVIQSTFINRVIT